ncbi:MAG: PAS domain S-box protein [Deltaproteobacteria bacterium]|nr:PAS domain S-box protein [Deltaproteobacteria bacterium]
MDQAEAYAAIQERARLITGFTLVIIIAVTLWVLSRWRQQNLSALHDAMAQRIQAEESFRTLCEQSLQGITISQGSPSRLVYVNPKWTEIFGYPTEAALSFSEEERWQLIHPDDRELVKAYHQDRLSGKEVTTNYQFRILRPDGAMRWVEVFAGLVNYHGETAIQVIYIDISKRKQAEDALAVEKERLAVTLSSIGDGVISTDLAGQVTLVNKVAESFTGWSQKEAVGQPLTQVFHIIHEVTRERREDPVSKVIKTGQVVMLANHTVLIGKDGREMIIADSAAPILDQSNALIGVVLVFRDITEKTLAEKNRRKLETQLRQAQKMEAIGTLAGGIAHDFNNILGSIFGYTQLAMDDAKLGVVNPYFLEETLKAAKRARDIVRQILTISRQTEQLKRTFEVSSIIEEGLKLIRASLPANIIIQPEITTGATTILGDPTQIHQVLINLCTNAAHAMAEEGGTLGIALTEFYLDADSAARYLNLSPGPFIKLAVSDTGDGIEGRILERIFDPFFTTKDIGKGTGMGLTIVQGIVKNHGGAISVYSHHGRGSTFNILLPTVSGKPELTGDVVDAIPKGTESVLLVDDEPGLADTGKRMLERLGYKGPLTHIRAENTVKGFCGMW